MAELGQVTAADLALEQEFVEIPTHSRARKIRTQGDPTIASDREVAIRKPSLNLGHIPGTIASRTFGDTTSAMPPPSRSGELDELCFPK
jgi:hypothetical protein